MKTGEAGGLSHPIPIDDTPSEQENKLLLTGFPRGAWVAAPFVILKSPGLPFCLKKSFDFAESFGRLLESLRLETNEKHLQRGLRELLSKNPMSGSGSRVHPSSDEPSELPFAKKTLRRLLRSLPYCENENISSKVAEILRLRDESTKLEKELGTIYLKEDFVIRNRVYEVASSKSFWEAQHPYLIRVRGINVNSPESFITQCKGVLKRNEIKLLQAKITRLSTRSDFPSEMVQFQFGELDREDAPNLRLTTGKKSRKVYFESWGARALRDTVGGIPMTTECDLAMIRGMINETHHEGARRNLEELSSALAQYESAGELAARTDAFQRACQCFTAATHAPAARSGGIHRLFVTSVSTVSGELRVGGELEKLIEQTGRVIGNILESFSEKSTEHLLRHVDSASLEEAQDEAILTGMQEPSLNGSRLPQTFAYTIDFRIAARSPEELNGGDFTLVVGDINISPTLVGSVETLFHHPSSSTALNMIADSVIQSLGPNTDEYFFLVDSGAYPENQLWTMEIEALKRKIEMSSGEKVTLARLWPDPDPRVAIGPAGLSFGDQTINGGIWRFRESFFRKLTPESVAGINSRILPNFFFGHALQERTVMFPLLSRAQGHLDQRVSLLRRHVVYDINDLISRLNPKSTHYPASHVRLWADLVRDIREHGLGEDLFLRASRGKVSKPVHLSLGNPLDVRSLLGHARFLKSKGCDKMILEDMDPPPDMLWHGVDSRYNSELRVFYCRGQT